MNLDVAMPPEPTELKPGIAEATEGGEFTLDPDLDWVVPITEPAPGRVVVGEDFAAHFWREWEPELRRVGFDYPAFLRATTHVTKAAGEWANDETDWESVVDELRAKLEELGPALTTDLSPRK